MRKKVYMFVNVDWFFFSHRAVIAKSCKEHGVEMTVFTEITNQDVKQNTSYQLVNSPLKRVSATKLSLLKQIWLAFRIIKASKPDLLHAVTIKPIIIMGLIARITKTPFIAAISGLGPAFGNIRSRSKIYRYLLTKIFKIILSPNTVRVICQNPSDKKTLIDLGVTQENKIHILSGSGVDLTKFQPLKKKEKQKNYVLMAARLLRDKGIEDYCNAAKLLKMRYDLDFKLAGVNDQLSPTRLKREYVEDLCKKTGVEFLGARDDMNILLGTSTVFVYPSFYAEGLPKVLQEAAACGTPVLTSDLPGCRDAVIQNYNGFLFEPNNITDLIEKFHQLMNSDIKVFSRNARSLAVNNFDENEIVKGHYRIYKSLLVNDYKH